MVDKVRILEALKSVNDPELGRNIVELGMVPEVEAENGLVRLTLALTTLACPLRERIVEEARQASLALDGVHDVQVNLREMTAAEKERVWARPQPQQQAPGMAAHLNHVEHVLAVMSGKGGVGKSSKVMSINLLLPDEDEAVVWRGPLIGGAIRQFWGDVVWGYLDVLVVDLPPGTSDAALSVVQFIPLNGVVLVTSPQGLAGMVVRKAARMAWRSNVPIVGLVENMSYVVCPGCGERIEVFGPSRAMETALQLGVPLLGRLPLDAELARRCDAGEIEKHPTDLLAPIVEAIAERVGL